MIQELKKKFVLTTMLAVTLVMLIFLLVVNGINYYTLQREEGRLMHLALDQNLQTGFDKPASKNVTIKGEGSTQTKTPLEKPPTRIERNLNFQQYFVVRLSSKGQVIDKDISHIAGIEEEEIVSLSKKVYSTQKPSGITGNYRYQIKEEPDQTKLLVFLDISQHKENFFRILTITLLVGFSLWSFLFLFAVIMAKRAVKPIADNMEKQRQFITNAGHEIKTPLAIIQSNADVLTMVQGENKWLTNIKNQVKRLDELTKGLLTLARTDEEMNITGEISTFSIKAIIEEILEEFKPLLQEKNISINRLEKDYSLSNSEKAFRQVLYILMDNATKYTPENGFITIEAKEEKNGITILQKNKIEGERETDSNRLFDRFYRQDKARTQKTGGSGIGLSIAQSVMEEVGGKIFVEYLSFDMICFQAYFPQKNK